MVGVGGSSPLVSTKSSFPFRRIKTSQFVLLYIPCIDKKPPPAGQTSINTRLLITYILRTEYYGKGQSIKADIEGGFYFQVQQPSFQIVFQVVS